ncbi:hypothetical protein QVD17_09278 [Tagetes erecta]|uniref:J domain-containing protein n=1 Tax=Tagetes erecta TaxID=13708 RepID=A0AAD8L0B0_TARER|nr:hypothetical protein QVD17_09278 [Tagetes erecta]
MECNKDEAHRAKKIAEEKMVKNDFEGARKIALKAKQLFPELDNISQLVTVCDIHCAAQKKIYGVGKDLYGILQVEKGADETIIRKQYRKLALALHPDKNKFPGAEAAFKLIGEANMTLSDKEKRLVYDMKCREPARASVTKIQNRQGNQTSHVGQQNKSKSVPSSQFNGVKHGQQSTSNPGIPLTFWTYCPFCNVKYEYFKEFLKRPLRCQHCSKIFIAYDIGSHMPAKGASVVNGKVQSVNLKSKPKKAGEVEKVKRNLTNDGQNASNFAHTKTEDTRMKQEGVTNPKVNSVPKPMETGTAKGTNKKRSKEMAAGDRVSAGPGAKAMNKKRGRKMAAESDSACSDYKDVAGDGVSGGVDGDSLNQRRSSRQRQQVPYGEDGGGEFSPPKRSKPRKSSNDGKSMKKNVSDCVDKSNVADADVSTPNDKSKLNGEEAVTPGDHYISDSEPELVDCPEQEFTNFDTVKEEHCFAVNQIWACYDSVDAMPRFYALIRKVYSSKFRLRITWLESDSDNLLEIKWAEEGLPVGCGKFVLGETEETSDRLMFSHQVEIKKGVNKSSYVICPQKGEIWALFKDWDINWSLDAESHKKYKFDIVEIVGTHDDYTSVGFLFKVKGFVSVFQRSIRAVDVEHKIPSNELFRFSHRIPSAKLTGTERAGVPAGSFELDMASLPPDFDGYCSYSSNNVNTASESHEEKRFKEPKTRKSKTLKQGFWKRMISKAC